VVSTELLTPSQWSWLFDHKAAAIGSGSSRCCAREIFGINFAPLFFPKADQLHLVIAHDDPGIRAADEGMAL